MSSKLSPGNIDEGYRIPCPCRPGGASAHRGRRFAGTERLWHGREDWDRPVGAIGWRVALASHRPRGIAFRCRERQTMIAAARRYMDSGSPRRQGRENGCTGLSSSHRVGKGKGEADRRSRVPRLSSVLGIADATFFVRRNDAGARACRDWIRPRARMASIPATAAHRIRIATQGPVAAGETPATVAAGSATKAATITRRVAGTNIRECPVSISSWHRNLVQDAVQDLGTAHALQLRLGTQ